MAATDPQKLDAWSLHEAQQAFWHGTPLDNRVFTVIEYASERVRREECEAALPAGWDLSLQTGYGTPAKPYRVVAMRADGVSVATFGATPAEAYEKCTELRKRRR